MTLEQIRQLNLDDIDSLGIKTLVEHIKTFNNP